MIKNTVRKLNHAVYGEFILVTAAAEKTVKALSSNGFELDFSRDDVIKMPEVGRIKYVKEYGVMHGRRFRRYQLNEAITDVLSRAETYAEHHSVTDLRPIAFLQLVQDARVK